MTFAISTLRVSINSLDRKISKLNSSLEDQLSEFEERALNLKLNKLLKERNELLQAIERLS
ncbi:hypothetical protein [Shouchella clausii]|uniref:hypothetical protein n=1 Tax=Shouchella clausii TaxID=79880 RepID=UPI001C72C79F|nr:hypothetical protein [Shouchella clausii]MBX0320235.1 hypothetical protein [Shouchella clausii]